MPDDESRAANRPPEPLRVPKLSELVLAQLRRDLSSSEVGEGATLPTEGELGERFGVSRSTIREAMRVLETEGLVLSRRGARHGARIQPPSARTAARHTGILLRRRGATIGDVYTARQAIEPFAARLLAQHADPGAVDALEAILDAERAAIGNTAAWGRASTAFHEALVERCGNHTLAIFGAQLHEIVEGQVAREMAAHMPTEAQIEGYRRADDTHARLVALVREGDANAAEALWRAHLEVARPWHTVTELLTVDELLG